MQEVLGKFQRVLSLKFDYASKNDKLIIVQFIAPSLYVISLPI